jgi:UDP-N-acetylmuramoyl-L-alanyl-D-glutamate--2,6-diaminopimelate ligase
MTLQAKTYDISKLKGLTQDSRRVKPGWLFAAVPGSKDDGRNYISAAIEKGAVAILAPSGTEVSNKVDLITDDNPRKAIAEMAARYYGQQPDKIVAITGTNGKTSTVHFTQQIWSDLGYKAASLGTLGIRGESLVRSGSLTTPDPVSLAAEIADLKASDIDYLALEASSHGLDQYRLDGLNITAAGFTSFSHDHLDYHGGMERYFEAKLRLFSEVLSDHGLAILNADISEYESLLAVLKQRNIESYSYGYKGREIKLLSCKPKPNGQEIEILLFGEKYAFLLPLVGEFQVMNMLCAIGLILIGHEQDKAFHQEVLSSCEKLKGAPGRLELVSGHPEGAAIYVDYAHTPDALDNILKALRPHTQGRLLCIVGCGGDRDKNKRPVMGKVGVDNSDELIVTDDNPRTEDPAEIRREILEGAPDAKEIGDRKEAIIQTISRLKKGDVLVIAGKGHETGQIIGETVEPFNDIEEAKRAINKLNGEHEE